MPSRCCEAYLAQPARLLIGQRCLTPFNLTPDLSRDVNQILLRLHHGQPFARYLRRRDQRSSDGASRSTRTRSEGFTQKYNVTQLVHYEVTNEIHGALAREKEIKVCAAAKKWR